MPLPGPDTHVVELRVPGLIGTGDDNLLDSTGTVDVAGDGVGRIIRPCDRLRRPAPGPVLQTPGRSVPRTLEGYLWNSMTSDGAAKAAWALLFPFSLANVAQWMLPPESDSSRLSAPLSTVCRALLRIAALLLTMLLVGQLAVVTLDLVAAQCLLPGTACLDDAPSWLRDSPGLRTAVGVLPLLAVVGVLFAVSSTSWSVRPARLRERRTDLPGGTLVDDERETTTLRCLHTAAALATVTLSLFDGPRTPPDRTTDTVVWALALVLLGFTVGATAFQAHRLLTPIPRAFVITLALALVGVASIAGTPLSTDSTETAVTGAGATVELIAAALFVVCVVFALLLVPTAIVARREWAALPRRLRPWAGGWAAAPILVLAALLGGGFGAGMAIAARYALDSDLSLPRGYTLITLLWGAGLAFAVLVAASVFTIAVPLRRLRRGVPEVLRLMDTQKDDLDTAADAWERAAWERKNLHRAVLAVVLMMSVGATALVVVRVAAVEIPAALQPLSTVGVVALGVLAVALLRAVYTTATGEQRVHYLAAFADLVCFWPRAAHPVVPPSYALKVVPELAARAKEHLREPGTRVVVAGYHVGGLLAVITAGRLTAALSDSELERLGLLTAGTPLQWGYQRAFPGVFGHDALVRLYGTLEGRWRGLCRGTDTFGGGATTWRHQVTDGELIGFGYLPDGDVGPLGAADKGPHGTLVLGGDHWLPDPMPGPVHGRRWAPGIRRHTDYIAEPEWDRAVAYAAGLAGSSPAIPEPTRPIGPIPMPGNILGEPRTGKSQVDGSPL